MKVAQLFLSLLLVAAGLRGLPAQADQSEEPQDIAAIVKRAVESSAELRSLQALQDELDAEARYARLWRNPELEIEAGSREAAGDGWLDSGGRAGSIGIRIAQTLPMPGRLDAAESLARARQAIAALHLREQRLLLRVRAATLALALLSTEQLISRADDRVRRFGLISAYLRSRPFLSPAQRAEKAVVENRLRGLQKELADLRREDAAIWARLNLYLNQNERPRLRFRWLPDRPPEFACSSLAAAVRERNPQLLMQNGALAAAEAELRVAELARFPELALSARIEQVGAPLRESYYGVGLSLQLPIFDRNQRGVAVAQARQRSATANLELRQREIDQLFAESCAALAAAAENIDRFAPRLLARTTANLREADNAFRTGRLDLLTYLELDAGAFETARQIYQAQTDYAHEYMHLHALAGEEVLPPVANAAE